MGPNVAAAAAEAAISALCDENPNAKEILDAIEVGMTEKDSTVLSSELPRSRLLNLFDQISVMFLITWYYYKLNDILGLSVVSFIQSDTISEQY